MLVNIHHQAIKLFDCLSLSLFLFLCLSKWTVFLTHLHSLLSTILASSIVSFAFVFRLVIGADICALDEYIEHGAELSRLLMYFRMLLLDLLHVVVQTENLAELLVGRDLLDHVISQTNVLLLFRLGSCSALLLARYKREDWWEMSNVWLSIIVVLWNKISCNPITARNLRDWELE